MIWFPTPPGRPLGPSPSMLDRTTSGPGSRRWVSVEEGGTAGTLWNERTRGFSGCSRSFHHLGWVRFGWTARDATSPGGAWRVEALEPPRTVVLRTTRDPVSGRELNPLDAPRPFIDSEWTFHLREIAPNHTRLLGRTRVDVGPRWALLPLKWMGGGDTVMQRRLLDGIKIRVEGAQTDALGGQCHRASP